MGGDTQRAEETTVGRMESKGKNSWNDPHNLFCSCKSFKNKCNFLPKMFSRSHHLSHGEQMRAVIFHTLFHTHLVSHNLMILAVVVTAFNFNSSPH